MRALDEQTVDVGVLGAAIDAEAADRRPWLPDEPWWDELRQDAPLIAAELLRQIQRGYTPEPAAQVFARKPGHGIRPLAVMSPEMRIVLRALTTSCVPPADQPDRGASAYAEFVLSPIRAAFGDSEIYRLGDADYSHIVVSDFAAFYQYIDHDTLQSELDLAGRPIQAVDGLIELLSDTAGKSFGLPQQFAPSHWLAEIYAQRIERQLGRHGFHLWRYSDDFRIGCRNYSEALSAIEALAQSAQDAGIILNEGKTAAPTFLQYLARYSNVEVDDLSAEVEPDDVEAALVDDYGPEDDQQALDEAAETIDGLWVTETHGQEDGEPFNLRHLTVEEHVSVRRALTTFTRLGDPGALNRILDIVAYQPGMTHRACQYLKEIKSSEPERVGEVIETAVSRFTMNEWQRAWFAHVLSSGEARVATEPLLRWLQEQFQSPASSLATAEAGIVLAKHGQVSVSDLDERSAFARDDFKPWYWWAMRHASRTPADKSRLDAIRGSSRIAHATVGSTS